VLMGVYVELCLQYTESMADHVAVLFSFKMVTTGV